MTFKKTIITFLLFPLVMSLSACTPQERAFRTGVGIGAVIASGIYDYPRYEDEPYYYYNNRYYYGGHYRNGYYVFRGRHYRRGHYYRHGHRYYRDRHRYPTRRASYYRSSHHNDDHHYSNNRYINSAYRTDNHSYYKKNRRIKRANSREHRGHTTTKKRRVREYSTVRDTRDYSRQKTYRTKKVRERVYRSR